MGLSTPRIIRRASGRSWTSGHRTLPTHEQKRRAGSFSKLWRTVLPSSNDSSSCVSSDYVFLTKKIRSVVSWSLRGLHEEPAGNAARRRHRSPWTCPWDISTTVPQRIGDARYDHQVPASDNGSIPLRGPIPQKGQEHIHIESRMFDAEGQLAAVANGTWRALAPAKSEAV